MVAAIGDFSVDFGASPILDLAATGVNGAPLAFSASPLPLPAGASLSGASGLFTFTPDATQVGDIALSFIVSDGLNTGGGGGRRKYGLQGGLFSPGATRKEAGAVVSHPGSPHRCLRRRFSVGRCRALI